MYTSSFDCLPDRRDEGAAFGAAKLTMLLMKEGKPSYWLV